MAVRSLSDIAAIEAVPLIERDLPESTYAVLVASAKRTPNATALTFFRSADRLDDTHVWNYAELVSEVTRAANVFAALGVATDRPAAFVLPNLPETHFTIWGGEAAGAALAINPMLAPKQIADLLRSARASVLVTLAPALNPKAWSDLAPELASLPDLRTIALVDMANYLDAEQREAARGSIEAAKAGAEPQDRQFAGCDARAALRPAHRGPRGARPRHILLCLHRRHDRRAKDCGAHASERGVRLLGCGEDDGRRGVAPDHPLWIATIPRQWPARDRPSALDARRPRGSRHARRLSGKERDRPLLGDRRSFPGRVGSRESRRSMRPCWRRRPATTTCPA